MKRILSIAIAMCILCPGVMSGQKKAGKKGAGIPVEVDLGILDDYFPVRSFYIAFPSEEYADEFIGFVRDDLIPGGFNNLVVRVNWAFPFVKHPELADRGAWSLEKIKELVGVCRAGGVTLVPMINLLGHQSWHGNMLKFLSVYPQFDERPHVDLPTEPWKWPNQDRLYCKSYCPNHPEVHPIVFACMDEILYAFEAGNFHAGMDEVFDLADPYCPRCKGMDPAQVFAEEVNRLNAHLRSRGARLWIWADRLLDGSDRATGYGEWSASLNNTHRAIDMIDRDVVMCDWHYRVAEQSAVLFALKGYEVITCGWVHPRVTERQLADLVRYREHSSRITARRYLGFMQTVWSPFPRFMEEYRQGPGPEDTAGGNYAFLKEQFKEYALRFAGTDAVEKDDRKVQGQ